MSQIERIIENINGQQDYQGQFDLILSIILEPEQKNTSRKQTMLLLESLNSIVSSDSELIHKFYSILIAKDLFVRQFSQFISSLSSSKLLQNMLFIAKNMDPNARMQDKGRSLEEGDLGNDYITLILQCIVKWSERYPLTSQQSPTRFRIAYQQLVRDKVVLPKQFRFFPNDNRGNYNEDKRSSQMNMTGSNISQNLSAKGLQTSVKNSVTKIQGFLSFLNESSDVDKLKMEIDKYHRLFQQQSHKNQYYMDKIMNQRLLDEQSTHMFLGIQEFYHKQNEAYNDYLIDSDDLKSYLDKIDLSSFEIREKFINKNKSQRFSGSEISYNNSGTNGLHYPSISHQDQYRIHHQKRTDVVNTNRLPQPVRNSYGRVEPAYSKNQPQQSEIQINKNNYAQNRSTEPGNFGNGSHLGIRNSTQQYANNHRSMGNNIPQYNNGYDPTGSSLNRQTQDTVRTSGYFNDRQLTNEAERGNMLIKQLMSKVTTTSKGFGQIKKELDQQRSLSNRSRNPNRSNRSRKSRSPRPVSRYRKFQQQSHFTVSRDVSKIDQFEMHGNIKVTKNDYSGNLLNSLPYDLNDMSLDQGWKRFRKANFKPKGILFQNQYIQIGYKSQAVYQDLQAFQVFMRIGIFIGNKVNDTINKVEIEYEGDQSAIMYLTPKTLSNSIIQGQQVKQDLVIIPLQFPFNPISCVLKYSIKRQSHTVVFYLPNSILKLSQIQPISIYKFNQLYQENKKSECRTNPFKLSRDFHPSTFQKSFQKSLNLTDYQQFVSQKSYSQYIIGIYYQLLQSEDYLCKIIVRPDMSAVIQLVSIDSTKQSILYGNTLVQTLQMMMQNQTEK